MNYEEDYENEDNYEDEENEENEEEQEEISPEEQARIDEEEYQYNMSIVRKHSNKTDNISLFNVKATTKKIQEYKPKINKNADKIIKLEPSVKPETRQFNPRLPVPNKYNFNKKQQFKLNDTDFPTL